MEHYIIYVPKQLSYFKMAQLNYIKFKLIGIFRIDFRREILMKKDKFVNEIHSI